VYEKGSLCAKLDEKFFLKVIAVNLQEIVHVDNELTIQAFYAGHVLGAAMFLVTIGSESVLYTGQY
jgi:integrator complex subunit 11